jgi:DNA-binding transcriptional regulator YdaS (Cro superfamily)
MSAMQALEKAINAAGGLSKLAKMLEVKPQVVHNWRVRGIPAERVLDIERATGVPRNKLRSDLYPERA